MTTATAPAQGQFAGTAGRLEDQDELFIGLDLGSHFGYAVLGADGTRVNSGMWNFGRMAGRHPGERVNLARYRIGELLRTYAERKPGRVRVAYELVRRHEGVEAAHVYGGLQWLVLGECSAYGLTAETVEVAELKRAAVGAGGGKMAGKGAVLAAALERWGGVQDDNEADSLWISEVLRRRALGVAW